MKELKELREIHKDLEVLFMFLDRITFKMIKSSVEQKTDDTITFVDYNDNEKYYVSLEKANKIIDYCYTEYFFKIVLSGSNFYKKVKQVSLDLEIEPPIFDLFFRSLFLAVKIAFDCEFKNDYHYIRNLVYEIVENAPSESFGDYQRINQKIYFHKSKMMLKKLEELKIISFYQSDITKEETLQAYFFISCDTFKFYPNKIKPGFESFSQVFEFFDLKLYLNNQDYISSTFLKKLDKSIQMMILICVTDTRFINNELSDNSYIKQFNLNKKFLEQRYIFNA